MPSAFASTHTSPQARPYRPALNAGPATYDVRLELAERAQHRPRRRCALFGEVVVAADDRRDNLAGIPERRLQRAPRSVRSVTHLDRQIGLLFTSDACKKLVQEMNDFDGLCHDVTSPPINIRQSFGMLQQAQMAGKHPGRRVTVQSR